MNIFILLEIQSPETFKAMATPFRVWMKNGHPLPVFIHKSELQIYADSLPIEFLDMKEHHRMLVGSGSALKNRRESLGPPRSVPSGAIGEAAQIEAGASCGARDQDKRNYCRDSLGSLSSVLTLYRAALRLARFL